MNLSLFFFFFPHSQLWPVQLPVAMSSIMQQKHANFPTCVLHEELSADV